MVAAQIEGGGPALFIVEGGTEGLSASPSRRWASAQRPPGG